MTQGVYYIKNTVTNKVYIGSSRDVEARIKSHFSDMKCGRAPRKMQKDYERFKEKSFTYGLLEEIENEDDLLEAEEKYINLYNSITKGYNSILPVPRGTNSVNIKFTDKQYRLIEKIARKERKSVPSWILSIIKEKINNSKI